MNIQVVGYHLFLRLTVLVQKLVHAIYPVLEHILFGEH